MNIEETVLATEPCTQRDQVVAMAFWLEPRIHELGEYRHYCEQSDNPGIAELLRRTNLMNEMAFASWKPALEKFLKKHRAGEEVSAEDIEDHVLWMYDAVSELLDGSDHMMLQLEGALVIQKIGLLDD